jgi:hydrogenase maturation protease
MKPVAIIGIGNYLMGDEGVGIHAAERLRLEKWPDDVELIDGGTSGVALLHMIDKRKTVVFIDCADFGAAPGEIGVFDPEELAMDQNTELGLHETGLLEALTLAKQTLDDYPENIRIIGIQPKTIDIKIGLSKEVQKAVDNLADFLFLILKNG